MLLTWEFKSVEEVQEFLAGLTAKPQLAGQLGVAKPTGAVAVEPAKHSENPPVLVPEPRAEVTAASLGIPAGIVVPEKKKRGPKPKAEKVAEKEYGIEDCRAALSGLFDAKGRDAAKAALAEFKVARIGELKADQYRGFIVLCETLSQPE